MTVLNRIVKPKTQKARRALDDRAPKIIENAKKTLFLQGQNTSEHGRLFLKDIYAMKRQNSMSFSRKNKILPFEDALPLERLSQKHDISLFAMCTHSKKRPNNIILGRMFDHHLLDMVEFGLENYSSLSEFNNSKVSVGNKPCLIFSGAPFDEESDYQKIKNIFMDFFRGVEATDVNLQGFEHAILFTALEGSILIRSYKIQLKKSGTRIPRVELEEIGPSMSLKIRRSKFASEDLMKRACKQHKILKKKKVKNIEKDVFGSKLGRIHMTKQDYSKLQTRKVRALKKAASKSKPSEKETKTAQEENMEVDE